MRVVPSQLRLKTTFITELNYTANPSLEAPPEGYSYLVDLSDILVSTSAMQDEDEEGEWCFNVEVATDAAKNPALPYSFKLSVFGMVEADPTLDPDLIKNNSLSLLYSIAREALLSATSRSPYPGAMLPTVAFMPEPKVLEQETIPFNRQAIGGAGKS